MVVLSSLWVPVDGRRGESRTAQLTRGALVTVVIHAEEQPARTASGASERYQRDPHWRDLILFHEYFHGDTGVGLGASHQTGWTALVAKLLQQTG